MPKRIFLIPLVSILLFSIFVWQSLPVQDCDPCPDTDSIQDSYQCDDSVTFGVVKTRRTLLINSVLFGAMALGALGTFVILPMMFDAPGTEHDPTVWGCVVMVLALPMMAFISITGSWIAYLFGHLPMALIISLTPVLVGLFFMVGAFRSRKGFG